MKRAIIAAAVAGLACSAASADVYNDNVGGTAGGGDLHQFFADQGFNHLDISSVEITNDNQFLYINISTDGLVSDQNWGKYIVGIDTGANAGDNSTDPGSWNRNVDWGRGITHFAGTWADDGGALQFGGELRGFDGVGWNLLGATYNGDTNIAGTSASGQMIQIEYAALGLSIGDTFEFDVFSSGGGADPGVDHLSRSDAATTDWGTTSVAGNFLSYRIVPAPGTLALLGLGALAGVRRRR